MGLHAAKTEGPTADFPLDWDDIENRPGIYETPTHDGRVVIGHTSSGGRARLYVNECGAVSPLVVDNFRDKRFRVSPDKFTFANEG
jgi:hypothetical protein